MGRSDSVGDDDLTVAVEPADHRGAGARTSGAPSGDKREDDRDEPSALVHPGLAWRAGGAGRDVVDAESRDIDPTSPRYDPDQAGGEPWERLDDFYTCPDHIATGGYESCCACGGWTEDDPDRGRKCSEASDG